MFPSASDTLMQQQQKGKLPRAWRNAKERCRSLWMWHCDVAFRLAGGLVFSRLSALGGHFEFETSWNNVTTNGLAFVQRFVLRVLWFFCHFTLGFSASALWHHFWQSNFVSHFPFALSSPWRSPQGELWPNSPIHLFRSELHLHIFVALCNCAYFRCVIKRMLWMFNAPILWIFQVSWKFRPTNMCSVVRSAWCRLSAVFGGGGGGGGVGIQSTNALHMRWMQKRCRIRQRDGRWCHRPRFRRKSPKQYRVWHGPNQRMTSFAYLRIHDVADTLFSRISIAFSLSHYLPLLSPCRWMASPMPDCQSNGEHKNVFVMNKRRRGLWFVLNEKRRKNKQFCLAATETQTAECVKN